MRFQCQIVNKDNNTTQAKKIFHIEIHRNGSTIHESISTKPKITFCAPVNFAMRQHTCNKKACVVLQMTNSLDTLRNNRT